MLGNVQFKISLIRIIKMKYIDIFKITNVKKFVNIQ